MYGYVRFYEASDAQVAWGGGDDPRQVLEVGKLYKVEAREVHSWHTKIKLVGVEGWFNDACFFYDD